MNDYRVKITIRNDRILSKIEELGFPSVMKFCEHTGMAYTSTNDIISGKVPPICEGKRAGELREIVKLLLENLDMTLEEAFTEKQLKGFSKNTYEVKVKENQLLQMINPAKNQEVKVIEQDVKSSLSEIFSKYLTPREEKVLRMRFGIGLDTDHTYEEVGLEFCVSRERVRQIEQRALRKMQHPNIKQKLLTTGFYEIFGKVNIKPEQLKTYNEVN
jgi:RNA polymerase sigma factor (sigma-70 family)